MRLITLQTPLHREFHVFQLALERSLHRVPLRGRHAHAFGLTQPCPTGLEGSLSLPRDPARALDPMDPIYLLCSACTRPKHPFKLFMVGVWEKIGDNCIVSCGSSFITSLYFLLLNRFAHHLSTQPPITYIVIRTRLQANQLFAAFTATTGMAASRVPISNTN